MARMMPIRADAADLKSAIRNNYEAIAPRYDWWLGGLELLGVATLRRRLLSRAEGDVLEIAVGTGRNLSHYPADCRLSAIDFSARMLRVAERRAWRLGRAVEFNLMDAEHLAFPDASFDTVVCTLATCTFPHPELALSEMCRVVRPTGRVLLLEHGYSNRLWLRHLQDRRAARQFEWLGCRWDREPHLIAADAGLQAELHERTLLGVIHSLVLHRADSAALARVAATAAAGRGRGGLPPRSGEPIA